MIACSCCREQAEIAAAVRNYLLTQGYRLTAMTFQEEAAGALRDSAKASTRERTLAHFVHGCLDRDTAISESAAAAEEVAALHERLQSSQQACTSAQARARWAALT